MTIQLLTQAGISVDIEDPMADPVQVEKVYGSVVGRNLTGNYDAVIITVQHHAYENVNDDYFCSITKKQALIADLKGVYRNKILNRKYWTL